MSTVTNRPAALAPKVESLREKMPRTTEWVDAQRTALGKDWVNDCIRRATPKNGKPGEPGLFYAMEAGHVLGTPFPADHPLHEAQRIAVMVGVQFAGFIAQPTV
jgi:hypothetical protein